MTSSAAHGETAAEDMSADNDRTRIRILTNAVEVFASKGFEAASLREIAKSANINHSMIKYYFGSKDALWKAAIAFLFERQTREIDPRSITDRSGGDPAQSLHLICEELIRYFARHPEHARLVMQASMAPGPRLDWIVRHTRQAHELFRQLFEPFIDPASEDSVFKAIAMLYVIVGACQTVFILEHEVRGLYGIEVTEEDFIQRYAQIVTDLLAKADLFGDADPNSAAGREAQPTLRSRATDKGIELRIFLPEAFRP